MPIRCFIRRERKPQRPLARVSVLSPSLGSPNEKEALRKKSAGLGDRHGGPDQKRGTRLGGRWLVGLNNLILQSLCAKPVTRPRTPGDRHGSAARWRLTGGRTGAGSRKPSLRK